MITKDDIVTVNITLVPDQDFYWLEVPIFWYDEKTKDNVEIGKISGIYIPTFDTADIDGSADIADRSNQEAYELCLAFDVKCLEPEVSCLSLVEITSVVIDKMYRKHGFAIQAMNEVIKFFENISFCCIILRPHPIGKESKAGVRKLTKHWTLCGFKPCHDERFVYRNCSVI